MKQEPVEWENEDEDEDDDDDDDDEEEEEENSDDDGNTLITVMIDRNILDCPVCHKPLKSSLFQCPNGHVACSQCCFKLNRKCKTCSFQTGYVRNIALESMVKSIKISCRNSKFGCEEILAYAERDAHERTCQHAPCYCPMSNCTFRGPTTKLSTHFSSKHRSELWYLQRYGSFTTIYLPQDEPFHVINGKDGCLFLLLNSRNVASGNCLSLACIRPSSDVWDLEYELRVLGGQGNTLCLKGLPIDMTKWDGVYPDEHFLFVPSKQIGPRGVMKVDVKIRKIKPVAVE